METLAEILSRNSEVGLNFAGFDLVFEELVKL